MQKAKSHKRLMPLYILNILKKHTDQDKHLRQKEIVKLLNASFKINCERKSVARNIKYLIDAGFDIRNEKGYYIVDQQFNDCEVSLMINNILYAKYIPKSHRNSLIEKLSSLASKSFRSNLNYNKFLKDSYSQNTQIFYTIEILNQAIIENKKVKFQYNSYECDKKLHPIFSEKFTIMPYKIIISNGWPYILSNNNLSFRLDHITNIEIIEQKSQYSFNSSLSSCFSNNLNNNTIVKFRAKKTIINDIMDQFENFEFTGECSNYCYVKANVDINTMFYWSFKHGTDIKIISPQTLKQKIKHAAQNLVNQYIELDKPASSLILSSLKKLRLYPTS